MARAICRCSLNADTSNVTGNEVRSQLEEAGFDRLGTASTECDDALEADLFNALRDLLDVLGRRPGGGKLDHLWVYLDDPRLG